MDIVEDPSVEENGQAVALPKPMCYEVHLIWKGVKAEVLKDITGFDLHSTDVYFFFQIAPGFPDLADPKIIRSVWLKHPDLRSVKIIPVEYYGN